MMDFLAAIYPSPVYSPQMQTVPVDNDLNNTTVSQMSFY